MTPQQQQEQQLERSESLLDAHASEYVADFCHFLTFETVSSLAPATGAYKECAAWLFRYIEKKLPNCKVHYLPEAPDHSPVVIAEWIGQSAHLPVLLLNSHYDVVPVDEDGWTKPAFAGHVSDNDRIYGRGAQDMKCVCLQYIQALHQIQLRYPDWQPVRTVVLTFVPDEEVGGSGMAAFLDSQFYKSQLPGISLALDEGLASTTDTFSVFYGERLPWWVSITATGRTGHGSRFIDHTAVEQIVELSRKALQFRKGQRDQLELTDHTNCAHAVAAKKLGDVTSLNITTLEAGVRVGNTFAYNCVPPVAKCSLDIRISPRMEPATMKGLLDQWCQECSANAEEGYQLEWKYTEGQNGSEDNDLQAHAITSTDPQQNPWYALFAATMNRYGYQIEPQVFPAATDSRFLRALGIRALGFSPMRSTEVMLHENDEYIPKATYLEGIEVYVGLLEALASAGSEIESPIDEASSENVS